MAKIVIIGAGLTGLSAAYHLEKKGFHDYLIFEKESTVGGLCRSVTQDGFTFDYTGHLLHASDDYFSSLIHSLVGLESFNTIQRKSFIYSHNRYTRYPYQINLHGLPESVIAECIEGFVKRPISKRKPTSFLQWVHQNFGAGFAKHFFVPYQGKIFAYDVKKLTASWTGRFVPQTSLQEIIAGTVKDNIETAVGYNSQFLYPKKGGIFFWVEKLAQHIQKPIATDHCVTNIDIRNKALRFSNGHVQKYDQLINTMPLDSFLHLLQEKSSTSLKKATQKLLCNSVVNFNLGVHNPTLSDKHWIYYPEKKYPFYRIGFPHNFSEHMAPKNCSSLYGEFAYVNKSSTWAHTTLQTCLKKIKELLNIQKSEVATEKIMHISHAYVIYDFWREKNLPKLLTTLHNNDIYCSGRYAEWKYASMQEAVLDGKKIADSLIITPARKLNEKRVPTKPRKKTTELQV